MDNRFYMSKDCDACGEDIFIGPILVLTERNGLPVIPFDLAAQETFSCDCGASYVTGDFDYMSEDEL